MNKKLFEFINNSPTAYHAVFQAASVLEKDGYTRLYEGEKWSLCRGGRYFVCRDGSSLIAFVIPDGGVSSFMISAAHGDSPALKIKDNSCLAGGGVTRLSCEKYGGMLCFSWFDRPLSAAGRVCVKGGDGAIVPRLVDLGEPVCVIPSVAIHMNPNANTNATVNPAADMQPLFCVGESGDGFKKRIAEAAGCDVSDILATDMFLYNPQRGIETGGFIVSPRLDDLQCAFSALCAFTDSRGGAATPVFCLFNNEEVGSTTKQGAASTFLYDVLSRICISMGLDREDYMRAVSNSFMASCDNAHAVHPNHPELSDKNHSVYMNGGVIIKYNANQKYTSDAVSSGIFRLICEEAGVPYQLYANRADIAGGSTLGNISQTKVSVKCVDIGAAQLAMHSAAETAGADDTEYLVRAMKCFYERSVKETHGAYYLV